MVTHLRVCWIRSLDSPLPPNSWKEKAAPWASRLKFFFSFLTHEWGLPNGGHYWPFWPLSMCKPWRKESGNITRYQDNPPFLPIWFLAGSYPPTASDAIAWQNFVMSCKFAIKGVTTWIDRVASTIFKLTYQQVLSSAWKIERIFDITPCDTAKIKFSSNALQRAVFVCRKRGCDRVGKRLACGSDAGKHAPYDGHYELR